MTELEKIQNHQYYNSRSEELRIYCEKIKDAFFAYNLLPRQNGSNENEFFANRSARSERILGSSPRSNATWAS